MFLDNIKIFAKNEKELKASIHAIFRRCPWCNGYRRRGMDTAKRVQNLDEFDCISHSTNTLGKGMNPIILPPAKAK